MAIYQRAFRKNQRLIRSTFLSMLEDTPFTSITITELIEQADISKGTFYHYYLDKYDLATSVINQTFSITSQLFRDNLDKNGLHIAIMPQELNKDLLRQLKLLSKIETSEASFRKLLRQSIAKDITYALAQRKVHLTHRERVVHYLSNEMSDVLLVLLQSTKTVNLTDFQQTVDEFITTLQVLNTPLMATTQCLAEEVQK